MQKSSRIEAVSIWTFLRRFKGITNEHFCDINSQVRQFYDDIAKMNKVYELYEGR